MSALANAEALNRGQSEQGVAVMIGLVRGRWLLFRMYQGGTTLRLRSFDTFEHATRWLADNPLVALTCTEEWELGTYSHTGKVIKE